MKQVHGAIWLNDKEAKLGFLCFFLSQRLSFSLRQRHEMEWTLVGDMWVFSPWGDIGRNEYSSLRHKLRFAAGCFWSLFEWCYCMRSSQVLMVYVWECRGSSALVWLLQLAPWVSLGDLETNSICIDFFHQAWSTFRLEMGSLYIRCLH